MLLIKVPLRRSGQRILSRSITRISSEADIQYRAPGGDLRICLFALFRVLQCS